MKLSNSKGLVQMVVVALVVMAFCSCQRNKFDYGGKGKSSDGTSYTVTPDPNVPASR